jgi:hypothetical protein
MEVCLKARLTNSRYTSDHTLNCSYLNADLFFGNGPFFLLFRAIKFLCTMLFEVPLLCTRTCSLCPWDVVLVIIGLPCQSAADS